MYIVQRTGRPAGEEKDVTVPCTEDREARRRRIRCTGRPYKNMFMYLVQKTRRGGQQEKKEM